MKKNQVKICYYRIFYRTFVTVSILQVLLVVLTTDLILVSDPPIRKYGRNYSSILSKDGIGLKIELNTVEIG